MCAWCRYTLGRFDFTHGGFFCVPHHTPHTPHTPHTHTHTHTAHTHTPTRTTHNLHTTHKPSRTHTTTHGDRQTDRQSGQKDTTTHGNRQTDKVDREREEEMKDERQEKATRKKRQEKIKMKCVVCVCLSGSCFGFFLKKNTRPSNNFEFSKLPVTNPEHDFLPDNFLFVRLQIKIIFELCW